MKDSILHNQALSQHMLFFDPLNKKAVFEKGENGRGRIYYADEKPGVEILDFGTARFNYYAPDAESVRVKGWGGSMSASYDLAPCGDGYWSCTADDINPGFHYCDFYVNGVKTLNPLAPYGYGGFYVCNFFEMPDRDADFFLLQDVPHGDIRMELYKSPVNGRTKAAWVYTPPGYDADIDARYPVLYIQHGVGENDDEGTAEEYGIGTYVYYRRRPFDRLKFEDWANKDYGRMIIRSKGLVYFTDDNDMSYVYEQAGRQKYLTENGPWYATLPPVEIDRLLATDEKFAHDWDPEYGDRMIKLVFIGQKLDREKIKRELDNV